jgi:fibronectin type 3 domain-containing protein
VTVGNSGTILTSSDGTTWTSRTSGTTNNLYGVTYGNSTFVTVGDSGTILTSSDGTTWTSRTSGTTNNLYGVTTTTTTLLDPSSLTATGAAGQVTLDWTAVSSARGYTVYWDNATGVSSSSTAITSAITDNYTHTGLDNGTTYYYKVAAIDSAGMVGALSSEVNAATPLPAPDNLSASGANNTIILTWNSVSGATSYTLYWDNVSGIDSSDTAITSITNDNYTHNNMDNGSTYYYKVAAVNSSGTGTLSSVASALLSANIQGSESNEGHTYALTSSTMSWSDAATAAAAVGGYLATLNTKAENTWLYDKFGHYGGTARDLWIGSLDNVTEGAWYWYNGTTSGDDNVSDNISSGAKWPDGTAKWASNEPNDCCSNDTDFQENCGTIRGSQNKSTWNDLGCGSNLYGIIEID